jgi:hypothetical protein
MNSFHWYTPATGVIIGIMALACISLVRLWFGDADLYELESE